MLKQEFLNICDGLFRQYGFVKKGRNYYRDAGSDILGSVHFQASSYGAAYYLNCGFSLKDSNECLPYPKLREANMSMRMAVPGKEKLSNHPDDYAYTTELIKYDLYDRDELERAIDRELSTWVIPAINNGMSYILEHDEIFRVMLTVARILHKIPE